MWVKHVQIVWITVASAVGIAGLPLFEVPESTRCHNRLQQSALFGGTWRWTLPGRVDFAGSRNTAQPARRNRFGWTWGLPRTVGGCTRVDPLSGVSAKLLARRKEDRAIAALYTRFAW
jgi:hypothetical protein